VLRCDARAKSSLSSILSPPASYKDPPLDPRYGVSTPVMAYRFK
jgi:hypothetical protein